MNAIGAKRRRLAADESGAARRKLMNGEGAAVRVFVGAVCAGIIFALRYSICASVSFQFDFSDFSLEGGTLKGRPNDQAQALSLH